MMRVSPLPTFNGNSALKQGLTKAGRGVAGKISEAIRTGNRSGRVYLFRGGSHRASAPGEIPASRTGRLAKSYGYTVEGDTLTIGSPLDYARYLELGTSRMEARPHLAVTVEGNADLIEKHLDTEFKRVLC